MNREQRAKTLREYFGVAANADEFVVALAGNPNVGKSTVFNALTGLRQHTGNWPGKTVDSVQGSYTYKNRTFLLVDLPGTYSLLAHTPEEEIARDFICFGGPDATLVVVDATCLERNLNLTLQVLEMTSKAVVCVNLMDEARNKNIHIDIPALEKELGVPVVSAAARSGEGLNHLREVLHNLAIADHAAQPRQVHYSEPVEEALRQLVPELKHLSVYGINPRWAALRLLEGDSRIMEKINFYLNMTKNHLWEVGFPA